MISYIGPGGVLTAIGSFLALLAAVVLAVLGFVWYPMKRLLRRSGRASAPPPAEESVATLTETRAVQNAASSSASRGGREA